MSVERIVLMPSWYPSDNSISGVFIEDQAIALASSFDVCVFLPPRIHPFRGLLRKGFFARLSKKSRSNISIFEGEIILSSRINETLREFIYLRTIKRFFAELSQDWGMPDLIHAHVVLPWGYRAAYLGSQFGIPAVLTEHTGPFSSHLDTRKNRNMVKATLLQMGKVIAVSPALRADILEFEKSIEGDVIGNVVPTNFFPTSINSGIKALHKRIRFLTICMLVEGKGLHYLIGSIRLLRERGYDNFEFYIGGEGREREMLEKMVEALDLTDYCKFLGHLNREQVSDELCKCNVFVLPSLSETFGVVNAEAMAFGKPVISTKCGGPEFVVTPETGILVPPADPEKLANAIEGFLTGKYKFEPTKIRDSVKRRFGENIFLENISRIYSKVWASK